LFDKFFIRKYTDYIYNNMESIKMNPKIIFVVLMLTFSLNLSMANALNRVALVIGNGSYKSAPLKNPVNDAKDIAAALKESGFKVTLKMNATKREMENSVRKFGKTLRKGGVGLFYYAGHGMQLKGRNYLIPINALIESESDVGYESLDAGRVLGKMEDAGNNLNIVILDACRNNPFARSFRSTTPGLARMDAPKGSLIAYATAPGSIAADGDGRNGVYTKHLLENIRKPGLTVEQVLKNVRVAVVSDTSSKQIPWEASSLMGNFYFNQAQDKEESKVAPLLAAENQTPDKCRLFVNTMPEGARVRILNIKPKFFQGIELLPGKYYIEVSFKKHVASKQWISIKQGEQKTIDIVLSALQEGLLAVDPSQIPSTQNRTKKDSTDLETLLAQAKAEKQKQERKLEHEKNRKNELKHQIVLYENLIKNYGNKYKSQAWKALCKDFPLLTAGLRTGDISSLRQAASLYKAGETFKDPATGMEFVWVPEGCFNMGSSSGGEDERPVHKVCLAGFWIGKYEVTQGQWKKIMGFNPSNFQSGDDYPVEKVSWDDVQKYISKLQQQSGNSFSLPTEAQWEYAARSGGKNQEYAGGNDIDRVAWYSSNSGSKTHRVGTKASNGLGIHDMSGNVWEWCEDVYDKNAYSKHDRKNPVMTSGGSSRVFSGGSWFHNPRHMRAANRRGDSADYRDDCLGFRLCLSRVRK
jgi:formylglycine-generating enzyme required for sulfatase activity